MPTDFAVSFQTILLDYCITTVQEIQQRISRFAPFLLLVVCCSGETAVLRTVTHDHRCIPI